MSYQKYRQNIVKAASMHNIPITSKLINKLNERDNKKEINTLQSNLDKWKPITNFKEVLQKLDLYTLNDLHYIYVMYENPLKNNQKITIRNMIVRYYEQTDDTKEKEMYYEILNYYKLLE